MAITSRSVRQLGSTFQNPFENRGYDLSGDHVAAIRASFQPQTARSLAAAVETPDPDRVIITPGVSNPSLEAPALLLRLGGAAIVSYETDTSVPASPDALRIVLLGDLATGGTIFITDRAWNGTSFAAAGGGDGTFTFTAASNLAAGTVITLTAADLSGAGITLSNGGETVYLYQGAIDAPTRFLFAADIADGNAAFSGSLTNTGLTNGVNAVAIAADNATYVGAPTGMGGSNLRNISTATSWYSSDTNDNAGTPNFTEVIDTDVPGPFFDGQDFVILSALVGGGQSDAMLRIGAEDGAMTAANVARMFRDDPAFNHVSDVSFDLDSGFFFFVDSDFNSINRIMRGNIADLVSGTNTPTFTQLFATDGQNNGAGPVMTGEGIPSMEVNHATNKIVWIDGSFTGDFEGGWEVYTMNYDGTGRTLVAVIDTENDTTDPANLFGLTGIGDYALRESTNILYVVGSKGSVDGLGFASIQQNHIMSVNLSTGVITTLNLDLADPRSLDGNPQYDNGRLDPQFGQILNLDVDQNTGIIYFLTQPNSPSGHGGIWSYNPATDDLQLLWSQPAPNAFNTQQTFPIANMNGIEVDEIGGRIYITTMGSTDHENDGTPGTNEHDASIFMLAIGAAANTPPTRFVRVYEPTALGSPLGLEIDYDASVTITTANATYTEQPGLNSVAGPVVTPFTNATIGDPDQTTIWGAQVGITSGFVLGDTLSFTASGGITGSYDAATGVVSLTGAATFAQYQTVLNSIRFTNSGDNPTNYGNNTSRTISVNVFDGMTWGDLSSVTMTVVGINDNPITTATTPQAATEDVAKIITGISVSDPDADPASQNITMTLSVGHGTLTLLTNVAGGITAGQVTTNGTASVIVTATQNQINATIASNGLTYNITANYNGADTLHIVTSDNGNTPAPALGDTDDIIVNIAGVNDAPTVTDATQTAITILEDTPGAGETVSSLFTASFSDALDQQQVPVTNPTGTVANTLAGIAVVGGSTSANGSWQYFNGATFVDIGAASTASAVLIAAGTLIRFNPALNFNGSPPDLVVHLVDSSGGALTNGATANLTGATGGTTRYSSTTVALSESVTAVNDAPVNVVGGTLTLAEDSAATNVTGMSISDVDANPATDVFTVTLDVLHGTLTLSGVIPSGVITGNITGNGTATVIVTGTINQINTTLAAAGGLTYTPTGNYNGSDRVQITTDDGGATGLDPGATGSGTSEADIDSKTINVTAVNDPVTGTAPPTLTLAEDATNVAVSGLSISDVDATLAPAGVYEVTLSATNGTLTLTTLAGLTFSGGSDGTADATMTFHGTLAAINTALATASYTPTANYNGTATITLGVTDTFGGIVATGTGLATSDSDVVNVTVTAVNDPVTGAAPANLSLAEDAVNVAVAGLSISDVDATLAPAGVYEVTLSATHGTLTLTTLAGLTFSGGSDGTADVTMTFHGTLAAINTALATAQYTPDANYNGAATITLGVTDTFGGIVATGTGLATSDSDVVNVTVTAVNDTPVVAVQAAVASTEQVAGFIDPAATITDVELGALNNYAGSTLTVGQNGGAQPQDLLNFGASGAFTVNGANLEAGGLVFATYTGGNGANLVITFTSSGTPATQALVNAVVQSLQYTYTGDTPPASIVMNYSFNDGAPGNAGQGPGGTPIGTDAITINITDTPENAPPVLDLDANNSTAAGTGYVGAFTEGGAAVAIVDTDVLITDADSGAGDLIEGATIAINAPVAGDLLTLGAQPGFTVNGSGTATVTITGTGTAAQYQAILAQITFANTSDDPGTSRTINVSVTDGTATSNVAVSTINITSINDAPTLTATGLTPTFTEGGAAVDLFSAVTASTIESGQSFDTLRLTVSNVTDGASEILVVNGVNVALTNGNNVNFGFGSAVVTLAGTTATVTIGGFGVPQNGAQIAALVDGLAYLNSSEAPTDANRTVTLTLVTDSGGTLNGGVDQTVLNIAATVDVNPVNDAPVVDLNGVLPGNSATLNYTENQALTAIAPGAVATDVDNPNYSGGQLRITITNGINGEDVLSVLNQGTGAGQIGFNGFTVTYEGTAIGFFGPTGPGPVPVMFIILNGATVSAAAVNALLDAIGYRNTSENPTTTPRNVEFALFDPGPNVQSGIANATINVASVNDAPSGTDNAVTINEDGSYTFAIADFGFSDPAENNAFLSVKITTLPANGTLFYDSDGAGGAAPVAVVAGQFILASEIVLGKLTFVPTANANGTPLSNFTFQVQDSGGTANSGVDLDQSANTFTFNVSAINDAPVITLGITAVSISEDGSVGVSGVGSPSVADVDATLLTMTLSVAHGVLSLGSTAGLSFAVGDGLSDATMTFTGTAAAINAALAASLTYNPTANYNGPDAISIQVTDNGQTGAGGVQTDSDSIAITVTSVNDAPSGADNTLTGSEDDPVVFTLADFGFTDPADGNAFNAISVMTFPAVGKLFLDVDGPGGAAPVDLSTVGAGVFVSAADIAAGHLYFLGALDGFGSPYASFTFKVQDNGGIAGGGVDLDPTANTMTINLTPDNLPPVVDLNGAGPGINYSTTFVEDGVPVAIGSGLTVAEQDLIPNGGSITEATVTLTDRINGDDLTLGTALFGFTITKQSTANTIVFHITGTGTAAQYQTMLSSITYSTTNQDPTVGGTDLTRSVTVVVNDGGLDSAVATTTINITAVDDLPVAQPDAFTITESGTIVGASLFANNGSGADTDPDGPPLSISAVNGSAGNVNTTILLASGASLTVNSNGTFDYNPNTAFLPTPTPGSGASNTPAHDSFTYTVAGGNTVTVSITLTGLDTDDILRGTAGADLLMGGNGNDWYFVENGTDQVVEAVGQGNDRVFASVSYTLTAGAEVELLSTTFHAGTAAINLTGNEFANTIYGNDGDNILTGGGGADSLIGRAGNDWYYVDNAGDQVVENAGEGNDRIFAGVSYTLGAGVNVELLTTDFNAGTAAINLTGNELANTIFGNAGANILNGGAGADTLLGMAGNDWYFVDNAGDQVFEAAGQGSDRVFAGVSYTLTAGAEVETLSTDFQLGTAAINLTGNELAQTIYGNDGANVITGGGGADALFGLGGNDTYYVDATNVLVFESAGGGNDSVYTSTSFTLGAGQEIEFLSANNFAATTPINLTGNELANTIYGNDGANILDGKGGDDLLIGQGGADTFAFTTALGATNIDVVFGFTHGSDKIALDDAIFTAVGGLGALNANAFVTGTAAGDLDDRIIYNNLTGQLFYDADGSGAGVAVQFATLSPGLTLTATDFVVI